MVQALSVPRFLGVREDVLSDMVWKQLAPIAHKAIDLVSNRSWEVEQRASLADVAAPC